MQGGDLSNELTYRYFVMSDVVFIRNESEATEKRFLSRFTRRSITWTPNLLALVQLWRFAQAQSVRMELFFTGEAAKDAEMLWDMLDKGGPNPFADSTVIEGRHRIMEMLPYRPDVVGVIDTPTDAGRFGSKGLTLEAIRL